MPGIFRRHQGKLYLYDYRADQAKRNWPQGGMGVFQPSVFGETPAVESQFLPLLIQAGSNEGQSIRLDIPNVTLSQLGSNI